MKVVRIAINFVFGMPFLWALLLAVRGRLWGTSNQVFGNGAAHYSVFMWAMVGGLGALWLGVSLLFSTGRGARLAGVLSICLGSLLLVLFHP